MMAFADTILTAAVAGMVGVGTFTVITLVPRLNLTTRQRRTVGSSVSIASSIGGFLAAALLGAGLSGIPIFGLPAGLIAAGIPRAVLVRRRKESRRRRREAWPDAIRMLNAGLMSGMPLHNAMLRLEREGPPALVPVWARYRRLSATVEAAVALEAVKVDEADPFVDRLIETLILALTAGPSLATDVLSDLALALNDDLQLELHIESANLEQKINSRVVALLPTVTLFALGLSNPSFRGFYESRNGTAVVLLGTALSFGGLLVVDRLSATPGEPRVFTTGVGS